MEIRWKTESGPRPVIREKNGVVWLSFPLLEQTGMVVQGFTTRLGGVSRGIFSSMNLSFTRGDEEEAVSENFRRAGAAMGFSVEALSPPIRRTPIMCAAYREKTAAAEFCGPGTTAR